MAGTCVTLCNAWRTYVPRLCSLYDVSFVSQTLVCAPAGCAQRKPASNGSGDHPQSRLTRTMQLHHGLQGCPFLVVCALSCEPASCLPGSHFEYYGACFLVLCFAPSLLVASCLPLQSSFTSPGILQKELLISSFVLSSSSLLSLSHAFVHAFVL